MQFNHHKNTKSIIDAVLNGNLPKLLRGFDRSLQNIDSHPFEYYTQTNIDKNTGHVYFNHILTIIILICDFQNYNVVKCYDELLVFCYSNCDYTFLEKQIKIGIYRLELLLAKYNNGYYSYDEKEYQNILTKVQHLNFFLNEIEPYSDDQSIDEEQQPSNDIYDDISDDGISDDDISDDICDDNYE